MLELGPRNNTTTTTNMQKILYMTSVTDVVSTERAINYQLRYLVYFDNDSNSKSIIAITDFASYHS